MKPLFGWRYAAVCSILLGLPAAVACTLPGGTTGDDQNVTSGDDLNIYFPKMYSASLTDNDGTVKFQLPAKVDGVKKVTWSADPADSVSIGKGDDDSECLITVKKAGKVTIKAKAGSLKASATLEVTEADMATWNEGKERYNNGTVIQRPERPDGGWGAQGGDKGGPPGGGDKGGFLQKILKPDLACTNCHNKGGKEVMGSSADIEHTPTQTAGYSDDDLINIMTKATKPAGAKMRVTTLEKWQKFHKWEMSPEEAKGLIIYLRSLQPEAQGEVDFGGHFGKGGGGKDKGSSSGGSSSSSSSSSSTK
jgi:hypothetical protein